ncbi:MAG: hypothetical protein JW908_04445 [Anaerolineales bacterium]|nr:hypothetical protein [Anaerolineales bacterium]
MEAEFLSGIAGAVISLAFSYVPGLKGAWDNLTSEIKRLVMAGLMAVVAVAVFGLSCAGLLESFIPGAQLACGQAGAIELIKAFISALVVNQAIYSVSP